MPTVSITEDEYYQHAGDHDGLCVACLEFTEGEIEPDAEKYPCSGCGKRQVMGIELALLKGHIEITEEGDSHAEA